MKKILITYATAGVGHKKAALAIKSAFEEKNIGNDIRTIDVLDYTNAFFKKSYPYTYLLLVNKLIILWGLLYYLLDLKLTHYLFYPFRKISHILNSKRLIKYILEFKPDVIISTHFLTADILAYVKKKHKLDIQMINVVTDYRLHSFWISEAVDIYTVGDDEAKMDLIRKWKVEPDKIKVFGIPIEPKFLVKHDKNNIRQKLKLPPKFTVLLLSGGYGVGPILEILKILNESKIEMSAVTVCGHNNDLYNKVNTFKNNAGFNLVNFAYVDNVDELMAASDVYIGKAGGISSTEALAQGLPSVFVRPIPGQEKRNADLLIRMGCGIVVKKINNIGHIVKNLKESEDKIKIFKERIKKNKKVNAARDIVEFVLKEISEKVLKTRNL